MAITGCEFVCKNKDCKHYKCGVTTTSPWPLGNIDEVINSKKLSDKEDIRKELEELKKQGRKYACISLPDPENINVVGYRVHMWCEKCPCLWTYDAMNTTGIEANNSITEAINNANIPETCPTCDTQLKSFTELIHEGIQCTSCNTKTQTNTWFTNEKE